MDVACLKGICCDAVYEAVDSLRGERLGVLAHGAHGGEDLLLFFHFLEKIIITSVYIIKYYVYALYVR